jgi:hypothetical protein
MFADAPGEPTRSAAGRCGLNGPTTTPKPAPAGDAPPDPGQRPIVNVWSRVQPKYRVRAVVLLAVNILLFCCLCVFTHWLHVARAFDFSLASYLAPLKFWGEQTQNLNDFVLYPVNVEQTPMHGIVLGLLVASIVAVPISVAILYTFPFALPFIAAVLIFTHMPWMAFTLIWSCMLASVRPFRLSFRFGAGLVGMLPVILYLYLATRGTPQQVGTYASPDQSLALAAPWILAILAGCAMLGVIMLIAHLVRYRPDAIAPVMAVMFAAPAILFARYVGFDEVSYRVLELQYGPRSTCFAPEVVEELSALLKAGFGDLIRDDLLGALAGQTDSLAAVQQRVRHWLLKRFLSDRAAAYEACRRFIADHPQSRFVPNALYIQGWVLDLRLDVRGSLTAEAGGPRRELYSDYPHVQSEAAWRALLSNYPDSPLSCAARLRLAQLSLRRGEVDQAMALLAELRKSAIRRPQTQAATRRIARVVLASREPESSLGFEAEPFLREGRRLEELIAANRDDPRYGTLPLKLLAELDPRRPGYRTQLLALAARYPDSLLYDNLIVQWAAAEPDRARRASLLEACANAFAGGDGAAEALFRLAELQIQWRGEDQQTRRLMGLANLRLLRERYPQTCWADEAAQRLQALQPRVEAEIVPAALP